MGGWINKWMYKWGGWLNEWIYEWGGWMNRWMYEGCGWMNGWIGWMDERINKWKSKWMNLNLLNNWMNDYMRN